MEVLRIMEKWYESAVFYHMYPLGMLGAPKVNEQEEVTHRLPKLQLQITDISNDRIYIFSNMTYFKKAWF